jgi:serine/threonine protein kinase
MTGNQAVDSLIGRVFKGYKVTRFIARGGMGLVFEGVQESLDRSVAIKFLYPHLSDDDQFRDRFEREARAIARLDHPNIVRVLDFGSEGQMHFMILDFIDGPSLRDQLLRVQSDGLTLRTETIAAIVQQVGSALTYAHDRGYVHRDVKPGNIMLARNGRVFLTDFGVVKDVGAVGGTMTGAVIGTPEYMAPEQATGGTVGPQADLYSLAVVAYEMLVGKVPFQSPTPVAVLTKHLHEPPPPPSTVAPWYGPEIDGVILKALSKNPAERYASATEFSQAFVAALYAPRGSQQFPPGYIGSAAPTMVETPGATPPHYSGMTSHTYQTPPTTGTVHPMTGATASGTYQQPVSQAGYPTGYTAHPTGATSTSGAPITGVQPSDVVPPSGVYPPAGATPLPDDSGRGRVPIVGAILIALLLIGAVAFFLLTRGDDDDDGQLGAAGDSTATSAVVAAATSTTGDEASDEPTPKGAETPTGEAIAESTATTDGSGASGEPTPAGEATATVEEVPGAVPLIVFSSHRGDVHDSQVYVMAFDGSGQRQLTTARGHSWGPRISPDSSQLFFSSVAPGEHQSHDASGGGTTGTGNHDIYVTDVSGSAPEDLTLNNIANVTAGMLTWDNGWAWSPDSSLITYTTDVNGNWDIYTMAADGSNHLRLTDDESQDGWPSWTPDGSGIVFASDRTGDWEIFIMNPDGSNVRQLTNRPNTTDLFPEVMPSWCPSGEQIVFTSDQDGNEDIYIMNADGTGQKQLTNDPGEDTTPFCAMVVPAGP